jgi:DNA-binding transcriptional ArsR family regulator
VSDELQITNSSSDPFTLKRIRSAHRRRLLDRLTDGGTTVSVLARDTGLRIPHASAELRRMRNDGLVASDQVAGARGARLHLTQSGWEAIRSDELARAVEVLPLPTPSNKYCLLARDGPNILLGLLAPIDTPLVLIPDRPTRGSGTEGDSTGNEGVSWIWAVLRERGPRWFNLNNMEMLPNPPSSHDPETISSYVGENHTLGIVRARLVDSDRPVALAPGIWFEYPSRRPDPPLPEASHHRGAWILGNCHNQSPDIRPKDPVSAIMEERLPKSMLLRTARANALVIADLGGLDTVGQNFPISCLDSWITRAHPRLSPSERRRRLNSLRERLTSTRRVRTEESTWRRFRKDWKDATFSTEESGLRLFDTRGLAATAITSLIEWAVSEQNRPPLVLEIPDTIPDDVLSAVISHPKLRLTLSSQLRQPLEIFDELIVDPLRPLPWLRLRTLGGRDMPVRLVDPVPTAPEVTEDDEAAPSPWTILGLDNEDISSNLVDSSMIGSAIAQFPEGNEDWSNMMEASYPIAAWIASPPKTRWHRWQRLRSRLDSEWIALLDLEYLPLERLAEVADEAPPRVLEIFAEKLRLLLHNDSEIGLRTRPATDPANASPGASWVAAQLLSNAAWLPEDMQEDLIRWALEAWLVHPPSNSLAALRSVDWIYNSQQVDVANYGPVLQGILRRANDFPIDHDIKIWSLLVERIRNSKQLQIEELEAIIANLPLDWWALLAPELLTNLLSDESSLDWLFDNPIPWSAAILRPKGEPSTAPGLEDKHHPGCSPEIRNSLARRLRSRSERGTLPESAAPLLDLMESLDTVLEGTSPSTGRTHPMVGWLAQPIEKWPPISNEVAMQGDSQIAERIILRTSGYHEGLSSEQSQL